MQGNIPLSSLATTTRIAGAPPTDDRAEFLAWAFSDFRRFCGLLKIRSKSVGAGDRIPMVLTNVQQTYCASRTSRDIICKPRQIFFTTLESARDLWWFLVKPGARVVLVCQSQTDMATLKDIAEKFRIFVDCLRGLGVQFEFGRETLTEWTMPKRDASLRIIQAGASEASAEKKGRGGTINRLHFTEAAFFEWASNTFNSLQESVPTEGSEIVNESTPNGASGFYFEQWKAAVKGKSAFRPHFFPWWLHPEYKTPLDAGEFFQPENDFEQNLLLKGVSPESLKWYRGKVLGKGGNRALVEQEYPSDPQTCFLLSGRCFFDLEKLSSDMARAREPLVKEDHDRLLIWKKPEEGKSYVIGADTSEGTGGNESAALVYERGSGTHCATLRGQFIPYDFAVKLDELGRRYNEAILAPERNNHGHAVLVVLERDKKYPRIYKHWDSKHGWHTNEASRPMMLDELDASHRRGSWKTFDAAGLAQMHDFVLDERGRAAASAGSDDDWVLAAAIGWAVLQQPVSRCIEYDPYGGDE
jgi:hypothetical protein